MSSKKPDTTTIPVVDLGQLGLGVAGGPSEDELQRVAKELGAALTGVGFVYLKNHGIPSQQEDFQFTSTRDGCFQFCLLGSRPEHSVVKNESAKVEAVFSSASKFFSLGKETKLKYEKGPSQRHGYIAVDREKLDASAKFLELREAFNVKDMSYLLPDEEVPEMRMALETFRASCWALVSNVLTAIAIALDLERDFFTSTQEELFKSGGESLAVLRMAYYPTVPATVPPNTIRCGAHTDFGTITLLFQDDMGGLQVRDVEGRWVDATPIPGTIVLNAGDLLQFWTNGKYVATEHRVIIPEEEVRRQSPRQSIAFFVVPNAETLVRPLDGSNTYQPITAKQHLLNRLRMIYN